MNIKSSSVNVYIEHAYCECGEKLERNNVVLTTYPAQYSYTCPKCGKTETSYDSYPKITYKEKEEPECL